MAKPDSSETIKKFVRGISRFFDDSPDKKRFSFSIRPRSLSGGTTNVLTKKLFSSKSSPSENLQSTITVPLLIFSSEPSSLSSFPKNPCIYLLNYIHFAVKFGAPLDSLIEEGREIPVLLLKITSVLMTKGSVVVHNF